MGTAPVFDGGAIVAQTPGAPSPDSPELRLRSNLVLAFGGMLSIAGVLWALIYALGGEPEAAAIPFGYAILSALNVGTFRLAGNFRLYSFVQLLLTLLLPFLLLVALGGFVSSSAAVLWALIVPLGALLVLDRPRAYLWFAAFVLIVVISGIIDPVIARPSALPAWLVRALFVMNVVGVSVAAFVLLRYFVTERERLYGEARAARAAAEDAARMKSEFLANMSHEIRTPLNAVIGMTGLLTDTRLTAEQHEYTRTIRQSGEALLAVINDILDFSKIEAGRLELERQPFRLRECIEEAVGLLAPRAAEKSLDLGYLPPRDVPEAIVGDATRLRQVLLNLLSNAVKFTERGEVVVSVSGRGERDGLHELHFQVRDTGIGIPPDRLDRLFRSFSQVDASTTRRYGGTGLGLAICRSLVELMGGHIWVRSEPGRGSTFQFTIRAAAADLPAAPGPTRDAEQLRGRTVLIVDASDTNRQILSLHARAWHLVPRDTGSTAEALAWIRAGESFDVAIVDAALPESGHRALIEALRAESAGSILPVVVTAPLGTDGFPPAEREELGVAAVVVRPVRPSHLLDAIVTVLAGRAGGAPGPTERPDSGFDPGLGQRHPLRILLVEDIATNRRLALRILERLGYQADVARDGVEAVEAAGNTPYDLILMDIQMPRMDGFEAARQVRSRFPDRRPRIVAMTANALQGDREACFAAGMDDYVGKPIHVPDLVAALLRSPSAGSRLQGADPAAVAEPRVAELDADALDRLRRAVDDDAVVAELVEAFLEDAPGLLAGLRAAAGAGDLVEVRRLAHSLKGNGLEFGATAFAEVCRALESAAGRGEVDGRLVDRAEAEYAAVRAALRRRHPLTRA